MPVSHERERGFMPDEESAGARAQPAFKRAYGRAGAKVCMTCGAVLVILPGLVWLISSPDYRQTRTANYRANNAVSDTPLPVSVPEILKENYIRHFKQVATLQEKRNQKQNIKDKAQLLALYQQWKAAWPVRDLESCMKLYSTQAHIMPNDNRLYDYMGFRTWLSYLWGGQGYKVTDLETPSLSINNNRAVLTAKQKFGEGQGFRVTSAFVWERKPQQSGQWRIIGQTFQSF